MQIVIDIDENRYKVLKSLKDVGLEYYYNAIANGKVLPSGHGRLIDTSTLHATFCDASWNTREKGFWFYSVDDIKNAPTVLEEDVSNKVVITLYNLEYTMERDAAINWMIGCISNSEGSEQLRYATVLKQLCNGNEKCCDTEEE